MLISYEWPPSAGPPPRAGTFLDVSGDPDLPVLRGNAFKVQPSLEDPDGVTLLIAITDGQLGAEAFMSWVAAEGDVGVAFRSADNPLGLEGILCEPPPSH